MTTIDTFPANSAPTLFVVGANGAYQPAPAAVVHKVSERLAAAAIKTGSALNAPAATTAFLRSKLGKLPHEVFAVLLLDNRHRLIKYLPLFRGTIDGASVHPREVVKEVLKANAAAVIFAHNHPSGIPEPSQADELITRRLRDALALVDVRVLDHVIIAGATSTSFAERGLL